MMQKEYNAWPNMCGALLHLMAYLMRDQHMVAFLHLGLFDAWPKYLMCVDLFPFLIPKLAMLTLSVHYQPFNSN